MEKPNGNNERTERIVDSKDEDASKFAVELLAVASHEIRTPLGAVLTTAEALLQSGLNEQQTNYATILRDAADALLVLSNSLLDATSSNSFVGEAVFRPVDLVRSVVSLYEIQAQSRGLNLIGDYLMPHERHVLGFPGPVRQVLVNLVDNALKYTKAGQVEVGVSLKHTDPVNRLEIRVRDSGEGVGDADQERIFESYERLGLDPSNPTNGQGLGLWVARRVAEKLNGRLVVETSSSKGTTILFDFPVSPVPDSHELNSQVSAPDTEASLPESNAANGPDVRCSVLVVDDSLSALKLTETVISAFGWTVVTASSGHQALALICAPDASYDCVLTDLVMPEMNGLELARAIHELGGERRIPVLAVSGNDPSRYDSEECLRHLDGYVAKPYGPDTLFRAIKGAIQGASGR